jgi:3-methyladenine DNA glycosylase AlkC
MISQNKSVSNVNNQYGFKTERTSSHAAEIWKDNNATTTTLNKEANRKVVKKGQLNESN